MSVKLSENSVACLCPMGKEELLSGIRMSVTDPKRGHIFFIHSSVDGHLGCLHVLAIINSTAMNIGVHESFQTMFFP